MKQLDVVTGYFPFWFGPKPNGESGKVRVGLVLKVVGDMAYVAPGHSNAVHRSHDDALWVGAGGSESLHKATIFRVGRAYRFNVADLKKIGSLDLKGPGAAAGLRWFIPRAEAVFEAAKVGGKLEE